MRTVDVASSDRLEFAVSGSTYTSGLTLHQSNVVGVNTGTAVPGRKLEVYYGSNIPQLRLTNSSGIYGELMSHQLSGSINEFSMYVDGQNYTQFFMPYSSNSIGIGTDDPYMSAFPAARLGVLQNSESGPCSPCYGIYIDGSTTYPRIVFKSGHASFAGVVNREGAKEMFFGEDADTGNWDFRGTGVFGITSGKLALGTDQVPAQYRLYANGSMYSTGGWQSSDQRLKENITPLEDVSSKLEHLTGVSFDWKVSQFPNKGLPEGKQLGLIAQEVETQFPELINYDNEGFKTLSYNGFSAILVQAFKELKSRLDSLETNLNQGILTLQGLTSRKITVETAIIKNLQLADWTTGEEWCLGISNGQRVVKIAPSAGNCE